MKKNLIFYCFINDQHSIDQPTLLALRCLEHYGSLFDGQKVVFVGSNDPNSLDRSGVSEMFSFLDGVEIEYVTNNPNTRESEHFIDMLSIIRDVHSLTFYAHNKGSTHPLDDSLMHWIHMMYFFNLSEYVFPSINLQLENHTISGILRKNVRCEMHELSCEWHYSGAFFWINTLRLTSNPRWKNIVKHRMGLEFYPGSILPISESHCSFGDENHNFDMTLDVFMKMITSNEHFNQYIHKTGLICKR